MDFISSKVGGEPDLIVGGPYHPVCLNSIFTPEDIVKAQAQVERRDRAQVRLAAAKARGLFK